MDNNPHPNCGPELSCGRCMRAIMMDVLTRGPLPEWIVQPEPKEEEQEKKAKVDNG